METENVGETTMTTIKDVEMKDISPEGEINYTKETEQLEVEKESAKLPMIIPNLDVCFLLDCTGSMGSYIERSRNKIKDIIEEVKEQYPEAEIHVGIVAYRDISDTNRFEVLPFTSSIPDAKDFLNKLAAIGGGDTPEDVNGAFQRALFKMDWESQAKMIVHIADAPCHGRTFHTTDDSYPDGYKEDMAWDVIFKEVVEKHMDYLFLKINNITDKMFDKFKEIAEAQGAAANGVLFKQEPISNIQQPVAATGGLFGGGSLFGTVAPAAPLGGVGPVMFAKKKRGPRKASKPKEEKKEEKKKGRKPRAPRSSSRKASPEKESRSKSTRKSRKGSDDEIEEEEEKKDWEKPSYWTRSKLREWQETQEVKKGRKGSRSRSKKAVEQNGSKYWVIPEMGPQADRDVVKPSRRRNNKKADASKERDRSKSRDMKLKKDKSRTRSTSTKEKKKVVMKKKSPEKSLTDFFVPKSKAPAKEFAKPVGKELAKPFHFPPGMSAIDEQEYFAKLLSKEMMGSIHRKMDGPK